MLWKRYVGPSLLSHATNAVYAHSQTLFVHPLSDYDFVIRLDPKVLSRFGENITADSSVCTVSRGFANYRGEDMELLVEFDVAAEYLADLQISVLNSQTLRAVESYGFHLVVRIRTHCVILPRPARAWTRWRGRRANWARQL
jgi:hypothetical protein